MKKLRLYNLPPFDGKEAATMIFEENVPECLVEGVDYETEAIAGLLSAGDDIQENIQMIGTEKSTEEQVNDNNTRQSVQLN